MGCESRERNGKEEGKRERGMDGGRRERDVRRFRRVHIVRGIRLAAGKPDVCAPPVTYRNVLGTPYLFSFFLSLFCRNLSVEVMEANT